MKSHFYHLKRTGLFITLLIISIFFLSFHSSAQAATNLLKNPSFESGTTNWQLALKNGASASFSTNSSTHSDGARSGQVQISKSTSNPSDIQLFQSGLPMTAGQLYTVTFWARATTARGMQSVVQQAVSPSALYGSKTVTLSTSWQQYSYTFTPSVSQSNVFVGFNTSYATGSVYLDNVSYSSTVVPTPTPQPTATPTPTAVPTATPVPPTPTATPTPTPQPTAVPTVMPTATPTPTPSVPNAVLYGKTGTFGSLGTNLPTGQSLQTVAVTNWGFNPGESEFFSALDPNGEVVLGTNPQTDNESYATADQMNIGVFDPIGNTFRNIVIPTTTGASHVTNPFYSIGGGSVDGITPVTVGGIQRIAFISAVPYNGWDTSAYGEYPSLGYLDLTTGSLQYNQALSFSSDQIHTTSALGASACPFNTNIFNQQVASCRGLAEMGVLPLSQKLVMTQYFPDPNAGEQSGRIIVMGTDGSVAASYTYPNIPDGSGGYFSVNPREIDVDPTSTGDLEYFSVIFDVTDNGVQANFPLQEFAYNRTTNQIMPISAPILSGQTNSTGQTYRFETAKYDANGNLWATQAVTNSLFGGPIVVYASVSGSRKLETTCTGTTWGMTCPPDQTAANTDAYGQTRSFTEDPQTHTMYAATLSGYLLRVKQASSGASLSLTSLPAINLGLDQLVDRTTHYVGFRKGVVDSATRSLYVPVVQVATPTDCPTWPGSTPCAPKTLDQWLYRFDLNALSS